MSEDRMNVRYVRCGRTFWTWAMLLFYVPLAAVFFVLIGMTLVFDCANDMVMIALGLLVTVFSGSIVVGAGIWLFGRIVYPEKIMVDASGITYHERKFSFRKGFAINESFYPWEGIWKIHLREHRRGKGIQYDLLLEADKQRVASIPLEGWRFSEDSLLSAIMRCCPQQDAVEAKSFGKVKMYNIFGIALIVVCVILAMVYMLGANGLI